MIQVHNFAELHNRQELMRMADEYILDHFSEVVETEEFVKIPVQMLEKYALSEYLNVDDESQVYEGMGYCWCFCLALSFWVACGHVAYL